MSVTEPNTKKTAYLNLFDENNPEFFAEDERADYTAFLEQNPSGYKVGLIDEEVACAFGLDVQENRARITWIKVSQSVKGRGIGNKMMVNAIEESKSSGVQVIDIAASHLYAPFFAKYGAVVVQETEDGWGPDMHRVDMEIRLLSS